MNKPAQMTVIRNRKGYLCKEFRLTPDGVTKIPHILLYDGDAHARTVSTPQDLAQIIDGLESTDVLTLGSIQQAEAHLVTDNRAIAPQIARTKEHFTYPPNTQGWLLWDFDTSGIPADKQALIENLGGPWAALCHIWFEAAQAGRVVRPSSSGGIVYADSHTPAYSAGGGLHGFILMNDASEIEETLAALSDLAWSSGLGWIEISASGGLLERSIIDASVGSPERPIFVGPPIIGEGLLRYPKAMEVMDGYAMHGLKNQNASAAAKEAAKEAIRPAAAEVRLNWEKNTARNIRERTPHLSEEEAVRQVKQCADGGVVADDFVIDVNQNLSVTAGEFLDDPDKWHRKAVCDPNEGLAGGLGKATLFLKTRPDFPNDRPCIISHAHGGKDGKGVMYMFARTDLNSMGPKPTLPADVTPPVDPGVIVIAEPVANPNVTHDGLALELGQQHFNGNGRFLTNSGKWMFWNTAYWHVDEVKASWTITRTFLRNKAERMIEWTQTHHFTDETEKKAAIKSVSKQVKDLRSAPMVAAIHGLLASNPNSAVTVEMLNKDLMKLGTPNGTVDLRTGILSPSDPKDLITRTVSVAPALQGTPTPIWDAFLLQVTGGDAEMIAFFKRFFGYALTGMTTEQVFAFFYGTGRNGKGVFLNTMIDIMGDYSRKAAANAFIETKNPAHTSNLAGLHDARFVMGAELPANAFWNESLLKDITGGDAISVQFMRQDYFDFTPQFTLAIAGNSKPALRKVDPAIRDRLLLVPFEQYIAPAKRDKHLPEKLKAEWPGILRWAIDGCLEWQKSGLGVPAAIKVATEEYLTSEDFLGQFIGEFCEKDLADKECTCTAASFVFEYNNWRVSIGLNTLARITVTNDIEKYNIRYRKRRLTGFETPQWCYDGVKLLPQAAPPIPQAITTV